MTRFHRLLAIAATLLFGLQLVPAYASFTDVKTSTQYSTAINALQSDGLLQGYADGSFKSTAQINRAEFLKIVMMSFGPAYWNFPKNYSCFPDVQKSDWFAEFVCSAKEEELISGYPDGLFHPERTINFVEASKILSLAYKQQIQQSGNEWYEGYVTALEASKAIPPSVAKLDSLLTRGEMAEMMWRLRESKTDQPSKGLLNLQHPKLSINTASDNVQYAKSCADLQAFTAAAPQNGNMNYMMKGAVMEADTAVPAPSAAPTLQSGGSADHSQTNVQVEGVDEGDIVKTDGVFLFTVSRNNPTAVRIVRVTPASSMKLESTIDLSSSMTVSDLYVDDGQLIVMGQESSMNRPVPMMDTSEKMMAPSIYPWPGYYQSRSVVKIYDISSAGQAKLTRTVSFDGNAVSSRRIGSKLYLVLQQPLRMWGDPRIMETTGSTQESKGGFIPQFEDSRTGKTIDVAPCTRIAILPRIPSPEYMTVAVIPVNEPNSQVKTTTVLGSAQNIYASLQNLYVATPQWSYVWDSANPQSNEKTHIYRFAFTDSGVELQSQGEVPGHILNQFSMDESGQNFRIATTVGNSWDEQNRSSNNLYVLDMNLANIGSITGIAPGETIYSVRFAGERAYVVTFKAVDPFFVIDLSIPRAPKILGQLKIPGFSNYLHLYDSTHVIGFGKDVDESIDADKVHSTDAIYYTAVQGLKLALFDVKDVTNPRQIAVEIIGDRGSDSPLLTDHKALLFEKDRNLLAFPVLVTRRPDGTPKSTDGNPVFQGAYVYDVSPDKGFVRRGSVTHYENNDAFMKAGSYWYGGENDIQRIVRVGSQLLTVSDSQVRSSDETTVKEEGKVVLK